MLHFAWPWLLVLLPLPWIAGRLLPAARHAPGGAVFLPIPLGLQESGGKAGDHRGRNRLLRWGALLCWLLLLLAASRPQWLGEAVELPQTGRNLLLAVDVSGSMETADLGSGDATRLEVVKQVAGDFIQRREGDRIGLILFGTRAYLQTPLTFDRDTVKTLLDQAVIGIAGRETAIGDAIGMALKRQQNAVGDTVLVLLTDGANTAGNVRPRKAAELAAQQGLRIHTIGVGGKPRPVPGLLGMRMVSPASALDEKTLKAVAEATGGQYFRAADRVALDNIYRQLDELEPVESGNSLLRPLRELYFWPLGVGLTLSLGLSLFAMRNGAEP